MNANIRRLAMVFLIVFGLISLDLVYWQVIAAGPLNDHTGPPINRRILSEEASVIRGRIYDRNGVLLVGRRVFPDGYVQAIYKDPSLAQTLGYHSLPQRYGDSGLEASLNSYLSGRSGTSLSQSYNSWLHRPVTGDNVYLTIDERIQQAAATAINNQIAASGLPSSTPAAAVAFDPRNGQILASVSKPYFDPTCVDAESSSAAATCWSSINHIPGVFVNRVTQGLYPPGSTFKTLTLSAAIDTGIQSLSSKYTGVNSTGPLTIDGFTLPASASNLVCGYTNVDLLHAFMYSDNIVFAQVGLKLGDSRFLDYAGRFMLGHQIPYDIPTSVSGILSHGEKNLDPVALASSAFGQGNDHVSPMQMMLIAGTVANGGQMMKPILVKSIKTPSGTVVGGDSSSVLSTPINSGTAAQVRHAMVKVVSGYCGSGFEAQIPGVAVAGKTGTAQTGTNQGPDAWFISFAPAPNPKIAVAVIVENGGEGAYVAAPIAKQILEAGLQDVH